MAISNELQELRM